MPSFKYILSGKDSEKNIYVRFSHGRGIDFRATTGRTIHKKHWHPNGHVRKTNEGLSKDPLLTEWLEGLSDLLELRIKEAHNSKTPFTSAWLRHIIKEHKGEITVEHLTDLLLDNIKAYKADLENQNKAQDDENKNLVKRGLKPEPPPFATGTIRNYNTTLHRIQKFEKYRNKNYKLSELDSKFSKRYQEYASDVLDLSKNSISKDIRQLQAVCNRALREGLKVHKDIFKRQFGGKYEPAQFVTLNEDEINLIRSYTGTAKLENARDWLIIGCWTGCRVGDMMKLDDKTNIENENGRELISYIQEKTGKPIKVPVHPMVQEVLDRRGKFPKKISDVKYNEYIKELCKEVELKEMVEGSKVVKTKDDKFRKKKGLYEKWELISSHVGRRSFATNMYMKLSNKAIMKVTGHGSEAQLMQYIGEVSSEHYDQYDEHWGITKTKSDEGTE